MDVAVHPALLLRVEGAVAAGLAHTDAASKPVPTAVQLVELVERLGAEDFPGVHRVNQSSSCLAVASMPPLPRSVHEARRRPRLFQRVPQRLPFLGDAWTKVPYPTARSRCCPAREDVPFPVVPAG